MIHIENLINSSEELKSIAKVSIKNKLEKTKKYQNILKGTEAKRRLKFNQKKLVKKSRIQKIVNAILRKVVALNIKIAGYSIKTITPCKKVEKNKPVLFLPTHVFKEDAQIVYATMKGYARTLIGGQIEIIKTIDEFFVSLSGVNFVNRDNKEDRKIAAFNVEKQLKAGINQMVFMEGDWNVSENALVHHLSYSLIEAAIRSEFEIQFVSIDREGKQFFVNYGERINMSEYLKAYNLVKDDENKKRKFLSETSLEVRDKLATLKFETMIYKEAYMQGVDLNKVEVKCPENREYVYYTKRSEMGDNYVAKQIEELIQRFPLVDLVSSQKYILTPKTEDWSFYDIFHTRERVIDGEVIRTYID